MTTAVSTELRTHARSLFGNSIPSDVSGFLDALTALKPKQELLTEPSTPELTAAQVKQNFYSQCRVLVSQDVHFALNAIKKVQGLVDLYFDARQFELGNLGDQVLTIDRDTLFGVKLVERGDFDQDSITAARTLELIKTYIPYLEDIGLELRCAHKATGETDESRKRALLSVIHSQSMRQDYEGEPYRIEEPSIVDYDKFLNFVSKISVGDLNEVTQMIIHNVLHYANFLMENPSLLRSRADAGRAVPTPANISRIDQEARRLGIPYLEE